jgi:hypothetical protein
MSTQQKEIAHEAFIDFLDEICAHVRTAGGTGNPEVFRAMSLQDTFEHLHPNGIVLGFRNKRMKNQYQLSYQMKHETTDEYDEDDEPDITVLSYTDKERKKI